MNNCQHPEQCAEEATWMYNPHRQGWFEIQQPIISTSVVPNHPKSQGVCYMQRNLIWGNVFTDNNQKSINITCHTAVLVKTKSIWKQLLEWCLK